mgnify:CR=1 FL=1
MRAGLPLGALASGESSSVQPEEIAVIARSAAALRPTAAALEQHGVDHVYEEFDGTHSGIDHRLERSLPFLSHVLG